MLHVHTQVHDHFENVISTQQDCSFLIKTCYWRKKMISKASIIQLFFRSLFWGYWVHVIVRGQMSYYNKLCYFLIPHPQNLVTCTSFPPFEPKKNLTIIFSFFRNGVYILLNHVNRFQAFSSNISLIFLFFHY